MKFFLRSHDSLLKNGYLWIFLWILFSVSRTVISTADPMGVELIIPDGCEDEEVVPQKSYLGGHEGFGDYTWYRTKRKLQGSELLNICEASEDLLIIGKDS